MFNWMISIVYILILTLVLFSTRYTLFSLRVVLVVIKTNGKSGLSPLSKLLVYFLLLRSIWKIPGPEPTTRNRQLRMLRVLRVLRVLSQSSPWNDRNKWSKEPMVPQCYGRKRRGALSIFPLLKFTKILSRIKNIYPFVLSLDLFYFFPFPGTSSLRLKTISNSVCLSQ